MAHFFGFGSLVNLDTHQYSDVLPAKVYGFARAWINNDCYEHAFLSVISRPQSEIQGVLAKVWNEDWSQLDERELGYSRQALSAKQWSLENEAYDSKVQLDDVQLYQHAYGEFASSDKPILRSYLETVLYGYYQIFGESGVHDFVESTLYWTRILDDRESPVYPRYIPAQGAANSLVQATIDQLY